MRRRRFLGSLAAAACPGAIAQQPAERARIVVVHPASPAEIAVEQPVKYELVINDAAARNLGLKLPRDLLLRADEVIR